MTSFSGGFKIFYYKIELSLLLTIKEPSMFINPAEINTMFEALMTFFDTYSGKTGIPYSSTTDLTFYGFTIDINAKFQKIIPRLNIKIAMPLILLRSLGN